MRNSAPLLPLIRSPLPADEPVSVTPLRLRLFALIVAALLTTLIARLWVLQVLRGDDLHERARINRSRRVRTPAPRGAVEDRMGRVLITNSAQFTVFVSPEDLPKDRAEREEVLRRLAEDILKITPGELADRMRRSRGGPSDPIAVEEGVDKYVLARIAENRLRLPGIAADVEPVRRYPEGKVAAHLLGHIGQISAREMADRKNRDLGYRPGDFIGKYGVEKAYDHLLNGTAGGRYFEIDARGRRQRLLHVEKPIAGATVRLTIDTKVQLACQQALGGRPGAAVALDPRSGRILGMASGPAFDPNLFARRPLKREVYQALIDPKTAPLQNRVIMSPQPPGSTFKIVTAAAGLAMGKIDGHTWDYCPGFITLGKTRKRCHSRHGSVNLESALAASCDTFFYHAGFNIQPTPLAQWAERFGLGHRTGIDLPAEQPGTVPSPAWKKKMAPIFGNPDDDWYKGDTANVSIGQGDLQTTPLQMALVTAGIANNGTICRPRVVERAVDASRNIVYQMQPEVLTQIPLDAHQIDLIAQGLRSVVVGARGTSKSANLAGVAVAGKSGSAELRGGGPTHAWFVCYAPYENPTIAVAVFLETTTTGRGLHGGEDAAPAARSILASYFNVPDQVDWSRRR